MSWHHIAWMLVGMFLGANIALIVFGLISASADRIRRVRDE